MSKTILIVEDTPDLLENLADCLRMVDYCVWPAASVKEAYEVLKRDLPDLIITDLMMNDIDGMQFARMLKSDAAFKEIPLVIFSAKPLQEYQHEATRIGVDSFIQKPGTLEDIYATIKKLLKS